MKTASCLPLDRQLNDFPFPDYVVVVIIFFVVVVVVVVV